MCVRVPDLLVGAGLTGRRHLGAVSIELTGEGGLSTGLIRQLLQTGLQVEMADHLSYDRCDPEGRGSGNSRNGYSPTRVTTDVGEVEL